MLNWAVRNNCKKSVKGRHIGFDQGRARSEVAPKLRKANDAAKLNVAFRDNLEFKDGFFKNDDAHQLRLIKVIRKYRPDLIPTNLMTDILITHEGKLVIDSCF